MTQEPARTGARRRVSDAEVRSWVLAHPGTTRTAAAAALGCSAERVSAALGADSRRLLTDARARTVEFTDDDVSAALRRAADVLGEPLSAERYDSALSVHGGPSSTRVIQRAGSWNAACAAAGLTVRSGRARYTRTWDRDSVLDSVVDYLRDPSTTGSYVDYQRWARATPGAPSGQTLRNWVGTWSTAKAAALARTATEEHR